MTNEYTVNGLTLAFRENINARDIEQKQTKLGQIWANFIKDFESIGGEVKEGATLAGHGVTGVKLPATKALVGA